MYSRDPALIRVLTGASSSGEGEWSFKLCALRCARAATRTMEILPANDSENILLSFAFDCPNENSLAQPVVKALAHEEGQDFTRAVADLKLIVRWR